MAAPHHLRAMYNERDRKRFLSALPQSEKHFVRLSKRHCRAMVEPPLFLSGLFRLFLDGGFSSSASGRAHGAGNPPGTKRGFMLSAFCKFSGNTLKNKSEYN